MTQKDYSAVVNYIKKNTALAISSTEKDILSYAESLQRQGAEWYLVHGAEKQLRAERYLYLLKQFSNGIESNEEKTLRNLRTAYDNITNHLCSYGYPSDAEHSIIDRAERNAYSAFRTLLDNYIHLFTDEEYRKCTIK